MQHEKGSWEGVGKAGKRLPGYCYTYLLSETYFKKLSEIAKNLRNSSIGEYNSRSYLL